MHKYMEKKNEVNFDKIFNQVLGEYFFEVIPFKNIYGSDRRRLSPITLPT